MKAEQPLLPYQTIRRFERTPMLFTEVVPVEYAVSLPLPTRRWSRPAYAAFASPARYHPGHPALQAPPDRWWIVDARSGNLILLAYWEILPFAAITWENLTLPSVTRSIEQQQEDLARLEICMDQLAPAFLSEQTPQKRVRQETRHLLHLMLPERLLPQYRALTPDFFSWLE
ncbi:MAG: hypothetical protein J2P36_07100 [Ktedonobacteraceae bacterium]|nr:hypothetical protein [Ktedonobacteraceae bacterium]